MRSGLTRWWRDQRGQVAVLVAGGMVALCGLAALSVDVGRGYAVRQHLQDVADAAALAGARALPDQGAAADAARQVAALNGVDPAAVTVTFPDAGTVRVAIADQVELYLARVVHPDLRRVTVRAAGAASAGGVSEVGPRGGSGSSGSGSGSGGNGDADQDGTPDVCDADADGDGLPDDHEHDTDGDGVPDGQDDDDDGDGVPDGQEHDGDHDGVDDDEDQDRDGDGLPNGCDSDSDGDGTPDENQQSWDLVRGGAVPLGVEWQNFTPGQTVALKVGPGGQNQGNFHALQLGDHPGAASYRENLKEGYRGVVRVGDQVPTEPGNMAGPTRDGVSWRLSLDPGATWDTVRPGSPRLVVVPVVSPFVDVNGRKMVTVLGFAAFFLEGVGGDGTVTGRFVRWTMDGQPGGPDYGLTGVRFTE